MVEPRFQPKHSGSKATMIAIMVCCLPLFLFLMEPRVFVCFLWLRWVFVAVRGLSLVAARGGLLSFAVHGLLIAVASLVAEHGL